MNISILGAGKVSQTLGQAFIEKGHTIFVGCRNPQSESLIRWKSSVNERLTIGTVQEAASFGEVLLLAINPWNQIEPVLSSINEFDLRGKTLIDLSNNIEFGAAPKLAFDDTTMGEMVQRWAPTAHVVKTLNLVPTSLMVDPASHGVRPAVMWVAGDHAAAKTTVTTLLHDLGWGDVVDLGGIAQSRLQEAMGLLTTVVVAEMLQSLR